MCVCRYNKLGLDKASVRVDEVHSFLPVEAPLHDVKVKMVSLGTSHSALVTGGCSYIISDLVLIYH